LGDGKTGGVLNPATRVWLITGDPGVGKTTCLSRTIDLIKSEGYTVGGVISREVRLRGERTGFELIDLKTGQSGVLASTRLNVGPRLGKYRVNLKDVAEVGAKALISASETSNLIVCDEIGPMELFSPEFRRAIESIFESGSLILGVLHKRLKDPLITRLKSAEYVEIVEVTRENRETLPERLAESLLKALSDRFG